MSRGLAGWRLQLAVVLVAGALWSAYPHASVSALVAAYLLAWIGLQLAGARALQLTPRAALAIAVLLAVAPTLRAWELWRHFAENENLDGLVHRTEARLALAETPAVFPRLVSADRPQTFYVHAPGGDEVRVSFDDEAPLLDAVPLGHGLFRATFRPPPGWRADEPESAGTLTAHLEVDGERHARTMRWLRPLAHPRWLAPAPSRRRVAAVSEETDELFVVSPEEPPSTIDVGDGPVGVAFLDEDRLVIAHRYSGGLLFVRLSPSGPTLRETEIGPWAVRLAVSPDRGRVAVARDGLTPELLLVDARTRRVERRVPLPFSPDWVAFGADADTVLLSARRPAALYRYVAGEPVGDPLVLSRPVVTMHGGAPTLLAAVTDYQPDGREHLGNHFVEDTILSVDVEAWRVVEATPTATRTERQRSPGNLDRGVSPMGIDVAPDGSRWVAFAGSDDVFRYAPGGARRVFPLDEHPMASPSSAVALADGGFAVSSPVYGTVGVFDRHGERVAVARFAPGDQDLLRTDEHALKRRIGERTFYETTRAGISCQSCHLHGGSDGQRHNIGGTTLVATLDVRGVAGTPPYLRDGGYPTLGSLDEVAQTLYRGYRRRQGGRRPGLDAYLASLAREPPRRQLEERDLARERRGLDAFFTARCPMCHAPPAFTNLSQHGAEWMFPGREGNEAADSLDTPSLLGLDRAAPFLVDGRAETIESVWQDHDPAARHGDHAALSDDELSDLAHLLEGL